MDARSVPYQGIHQPVGLHKKRVGRHTCRENQYKGKSAGVWCFFVCGHVHMCMRRNMLTCRRAFLDKVVQIRITVS